MVLRQFAAPLGLSLGCLLCLFPAGCKSDSIPSSEVPRATAADITPKGAYFYELGAAIAVGQPDFDISAPEWELGPSGVTFDKSGRMTATWQGAHDDRICDATLRGEHLTLDCSGQVYRATWREKGTVTTDVLTLLQRAPGDPPVVPFGKDALHVLAELDKPWDAYGDPPQDAPVQSDPSQSGPSQSGDLSPQVTEAVNAPALGLPPATKKHIVDFRRAAANSSTSADALCAFVGQASAIADELAGHIEELPTQSEDDFFGLSAATEALSSALPGVYLNFSSEGLSRSVHWQELAAEVGPSSPAGQLMTTVHGVLGTGGHSKLIDWTWDLGGPTNLERAASRLRAVRAALDRTPACLNTLVAEPLRAEIGRLGQHTCYSVSPAVAQTQLNGLASVLDTLPSLGGPSALAKIRAAFTEGRAVFNNTVCGG